MEKNKSIRDIMTKNPKTISPETSVAEAAQLMCDADVGGLVVRDGSGEVCGIITDRDITVRVVAKNKDPKKTTIESVYSEDPICLSPDDTIDQAIQTMTRASVRRIPVVEDGAPIGIISLGDLAMARQPGSALGSISAAPPQA